jgi:hypothetical protein
MVILEKWIPKTQFQPFIMMAKKGYYIKRFFGETENKERRVLSQNIKFSIRNRFHRLPSCRRTDFPKIKGVQKRP